MTPVGNHLEPVGTKKDSYRVQARVIEAKNYEVNKLKKEVLYKQSKVDNKEKCIRDGNLKIFLVSLVWTLFYQLTDSGR